MKTENYVCLACGASVTRPIVRGQRPKWCLDCRRTGRRPRGECAACGRSYVSSWADGRYCSHLCHKYDRHGPMACPVPINHPSRRDAVVPRELKPQSVRVFITDCVVCRRCFVSPYTISTCSGTCSETKRRWDKREARHRRRARKRGAFVAPVYRLHVYERDRWRCQLCGKAVQRNRVVPHPMAPVLDHVIPLARGGTHEPANVQTAHYLCNSRKSDRGGGEQLRLIG